MFHLSTSSFSTNCFAEFNKKKSQNTSCKQETRPILYRIVLLVLIFKFKNENIGQKDSSRELSTVKIKFPAEENNIRKPYSILTSFQSDQIESVHTMYIYHNTVHIRILSNKFFRRFSEFTISTWCSIIYMNQIHVNSVSDDLLARTYATLYTVDIVKSVIQLISVDNVCNNEWCFMNELDAGIMLRDVRKYVLFLRKKMENLRCHYKFL